MKFILRKIKRTNKAVWLVSLVLTAVFLGFFIAGNAFSPLGYKYINSNLFVGGDIFVYFSYINQIKDGGIFLYDYFTFEDQKIGMFNLWWLTVGLLADFFNLSPDIAFSVIRLILIPLFVYFIYFFSGYFLFNDWQKNCALYLAFFSSGWGVFLAVSIFFSEAGSANGLNNWPIDLWVTEANLFTIIFNPLFVVSIIFTSAILWLMLLSFEKDNLKLSCWAGFLGLIYLNFHPYYWPIIIAVPFLYVLLESFVRKNLQWRMFVSMAILFFISLPSVIYHFWLISSESVISNRAMQNVTEMPTLPYFLIGFGFLWVGFLWGLYSLIRQKRLNSRFKYLLIWLVVLLIFSYGPFPFQSRYSQGIHLILLIFSAYGFWQAKNLVVGGVKKNLLFSNQYLIAIIFFFLLSPTWLFNVFREFYYLTFFRESKMALALLYVPNDLETVIRYFDNVPSGNFVILADQVSSIKIAAFASQKVFIGHPHETIFFQSKLMTSQWFFNDNTKNESRLNFLRNAKIDYIVTRKDDRQLNEAKFLSAKIVSEELVLYQVIR